jgi:pimeloyl-ACP methyl ester carboxylesterase
VAPGWLPRALRDFRVLMLDQRGTGRSSPVVLLLDLSPAQQAAHRTVERNSRNGVNGAGGNRRMVGVSSCIDLEA